MAQIDINVALEGFQRASSSLAGLRSSLASLAEAQRVQTEALRHANDLQRQYAATVRTLGESQARSTELFRDLTSATLESTRSQADAEQQTKDFAITIQTGLANSLVSLSGNLIDAAKDMEMFTLSMQSVSTSSQQARQSIQELISVSRLPGVDLETAIPSSVKLQATGMAASEASRMVKELGNALATVGATNDQLNGVMLAITQIQAKGYVYAEEIYQIAERLPQIRQITKEIYGTANTEVIKSEGFTATQFLKGLTDGLERLPRLKSSLANEIKNLNNEFFVLRSTMGEYLAAGIKTLVGLLTDALRIVNSLNPVILKVVGAFVGFAAASLSLNLALRTVKQSLELLSNIQFINLAKGSGIFSKMGSAIAGKLTPAIATATTAVKAFIASLGLIGGIAVAAVASVVALGGVFLHLSARAKDGSRDLKKLKESMIEATEITKKYTEGIAEIRLAYREKEALKKLEEQIRRTSGAERDRLINRKRMMEVSSSSTTSLNQIFGSPDDVQLTRQDGTGRQILAYEDLESAIEATNEAKERMIIKLREELSLAEEVAKKTGQEYGRRSRGGGGRSPLDWLKSGDKFIEESKIKYEEALEVINTLQTSIFKLQGQNPEGIPELLSVAIQANIEKAELDLLRFSEFSQAQQKAIADAGSVSAQKRAESIMTAQNALQTALIKNSQETSTILKELLSERYRDIVKIMVGSGAELEQLSVAQKDTVVKEILLQYRKIYEDELKGENIRGRQIDVDIGSLVNDPTITMKLDTLVEPQQLQQFAKISHLADQIFLKREMELDITTRLNREIERTRNQAIKEARNENNELIKRERSLISQKTLITATAQAQEYINTLLEQSNKLLDLNAELQDAILDKDLKKAELLRREISETKSFYGKKLEFFEQEKQFNLDNIRQQIKFQKLTSGSASQQQAISTYMGIEKQILNSSKALKDFNSSIESQKEALEQVNNIEGELQRLRTEQMDSSKVDFSNTENEIGVLEKFLKFREDWDKENQKYIGTPKAQGQGAIPVVGDLLDFSLPEIDGVSPEKVAELFAKSVEDVKNELKIANGELKKKQALLAHNAGTITKTANLLNDEKNNLQGTNISVKERTDQLELAEKTLENMVKTARFETDEQKFQLENILKIKTANQQINLIKEEGQLQTERQISSIKLETVERDRQLINLQQSVEKAKLLLAANQGNKEEIEEIRKKKEETRTTDEKARLASYDSYQILLDQFKIQKLTTEELNKQGNIQIANLEIQRSYEVLLKNREQARRISNAEESNFLSMQIELNGQLNDNLANRISIQKKSSELNIAAKRSELEENKRITKEANAAKNKILQSGQDIIDSDGNLNQNALDAQIKKADKYQGGFAAQIGAYGGYGSKEELLKALALVSDLRTQSVRDSNNKILELGIEHEEKMLNFKISSIEREEEFRKANLKIREEENINEINQLETLNKFRERVANTTSEGMANFNKQLETNQRILEIEKMRIDSLGDMNGLQSDVYNEAVIEYNQKVKLLAKEQEISYEKTQQIEYQKQMNQFLEDQKFIQDLTDRQRELSQRTSSMSITNLYGAFSNIGGAQSRGSVIASARSRLTILDDQASYYNDPNTNLSPEEQEQGLRDVNRQRIEAQQQLQEDLLAIDEELFNKMSDNVSNFLQNRIDQYFESSELEKEIAKEKNEAIEDMERNLYKEIRDIQEDYTLTFQERMTSLEKISRDSAEERNKIDEDASKKSKELAENQNKERRNLIRDAAIGYGTNAIGMGVAQLGMLGVKSIFKDTVDFKGDRSKLKGSSPNQQIDRSRSFFENLFLRDQVTAPTTNTKSVLGSDRSNPLYVRFADPKPIEAVDSSVADKQDLRRVTNKHGRDAEKSRKSIMKNIDLWGTDLFGKRNTNITAPVPLPQPQPMATIQSDLRAYNTENLMPTFPSIDTNRIVESMSTAGPKRPLRHDATSSFVLGSVKNQLGSLLTPALSSGLGPIGFLAAPVVSSLLNSFQFDNPNNDSNLMKEYKSLGAEMRKAQERSASDMIGISAGAFADAYSKAGQSGGGNVNISGEFRLDNGAIRFFETERNRLNKRGNI